MTILSIAMEELASYTIDTITSFMIRDTSFGFKIVGNERFLTDFCFSMSKSTMISKFTIAMFSPIFTNLFFEKC